MSLSIAYEPANTPGPECPNVSHWVSPIFDVHPWTKIGHAGGVVFVGRKPWRPWDPAWYLAPRLAPSHPSSPSEARVR